MPESVDFSLLAQVARNDLMALLATIVDAKDLVIEKCLMRPLDLLGAMSLLRQHGVQRVYQMDPCGAHPPWSDNVNHRVYLVRPTAVNAKHIAAHYQAEHNTNECSVKCFSCIFSPRRLFVCELVFEQWALHGRINILEYNPTFHILEHDLLSLQLPEFFVTNQIQGSNEWLFTAARALHHLQSLYGPISNRHCIGNTAKQLNDLLDIQCSELGQPQSISNSRPISTLFVMDRSLDYCSVLLTCFTYESLLNETFGIDCAAVDLSQVMAGASRVTLSNNDQVFGSVRNRHISAVFPFLSAKAKTLQQQANQSKDLGVSDLKQFVQNELRSVKEQYRSLELHIGASETVTKRCRGIQHRMQSEHCLLFGTNSSVAVQYLEQSMSQQCNIEHNLCLLCLLSLTQNGLPLAQYNSLRTQFLHAHGYEHMNTWHTLYKMGLLVVQQSVTHSHGAGGLARGMVGAGGSGTGAAGGLGSTTSFREVMKRLQLQPKQENTDDSTVHNPTHCSFVFNGSYTPLIAQIVHNTLTSNQLDQQQLSRILQCPVGSSAQSQTRTGSRTETRDSVVMVYMLGGVTYAEVAALRLLGTQHRCSIVIATTHIIGQTDFCTSVQSAHN